MTIQKLASEIAKREGKKSQARIGDIREIIKTLCTLEAEMITSGSDAVGPLDVIAEQSSKVAEKLYRKQAKLHTQKGKLK